MGYSDWMAKTWTVSSQSNSDLVATSPTPCVLRFDNTPAITCTSGHGCGIGSYKLTAGSFSTSGAGVESIQGKNGPRGFTITRATASATELSCDIPEKPNPNGIMPGPGSWTAQDQ